MKKIVLLFAMMLAVGTVQAKKDRLYATFTSVGNGNISWDAATNTFTVSGDENYKGGNNTYQMFSFDAGTLTKYSKIHFTLSNYSKTRILFMNGSTTVYTWAFGSNGEKYKSLDDIHADVTNNLANITSIRIGGPGPGSEVISEEITIEIDPNDVYLETDDYERLDISTTLDGDATVSSPFQWYTSSDGEDKTEIVSGELTKQFNTEETKAIISRATANLGWGNGFIDIEGYNYFTVNIATYNGERSDQVRLLYTTGEKTTDNYSVDVTKSGATKVSISTLPNYWIAGIWDKVYQTNSQAISSFVFSKEHAAASATAFSIAASSSSTVDYDRTFTAGQKSTVCLPFALTAEEVEAAGTFYELADYDGTTLTFNTVSTTEAYKPYLFEAKTTGTPFTNLTNRAIVASSDATTYYTTADNGGFTATFTGTLVHQSVNGKYGWNSTDGTFSKATSDDVTIDAFRAYVTVSGVATSRGLSTVFSDDESAGIETICHEPSNVSKTYNLQGQRVGDGHKGLVIKNGKKAFVR